MTDATQTDGGPGLPVSELFDLNAGAEIYLMACSDGDVGIACDEDGWDQNSPAGYVSTTKAREIGHALIKMADELDAFLAARQEAPDG